MLQLLEPCRLAHAGQFLKDLVHVLAHAFFTGHQPVIGVQLGGLGVVIAGAQVHIAFDSVAVTAHHQQHFCVGLVAHHAVHHDGAGFLQTPGPFDIGLFIEAGAQFHDGSDFLAIACGRFQVVENFRLGAGAVQGLLDGQHLRVPRGFGQQVDYRLERFVGVVQQDVALVDGIKNGFIFFHRRRQLGGKGRVVQARAIDAGKHARQVHRAVHFVQVFLGEFELFQQIMHQVARAIVGHFQAHFIPVTT